MLNDSSSNFVDTGVAELLALFRGELAQLTFPGVDASTLDAAVGAVAEQADAVEQLRLAHQDALDTLRSKQRALREHARQAHAYARVFARSDAQLSAQLEQIVLDEPAMKATKKRRGRKAKATPSPAPQLKLESAPPAKPAKPNETTKAA